MKKVLQIISGVGAAGVVALGIFLYVTRAPIYRVTSLDMLKNEMAALDDHTLVIFDVDDVLIANADPYEREYFDQRNADKTILSLYDYHSDLNKNVDRATRDRLWHSYMATFPSLLLATDAPALIDELKKKGVKVIALTGVWLDAHDNEIEALRTKELAAVGIDFKGAFDSFDGLELKACNFEGRSPIFKDGILYTALACQTKGAVLTEFFKAIGWRPNKIIAIDDKRHNLTALYDVARDLHIPYEGLLYKKASTIPAYYDRHAAEHQLHYAMHEGRWITAREARALIDMENEKVAGCRCGGCKH